LSNRDRSVVGARHQREARLALMSLIMPHDDTAVTTTGEGHQQQQQLPCQDNNTHMAIMGSNATSLLDQLAQKISVSGLIVQGDEIVLASENHCANVTPWLEVARVYGATVKWWTVADTKINNIGIATTNKEDHGGEKVESCILSELITTKTKIVAVSHVSNILGMERDIPAICSLVHCITGNRGQVVVDGVAAAPHLLSTRANHDQQQEWHHVDWYVVSLHKLFGPHLGCLIGKRSMVQQLIPNPHDEALTAVACCKAELDFASPLLSDNQLAKAWELGTINYEACCGAIALKQYFERMGKKAHESFGMSQYCISGDGHVSLTVTTTSDMCRSSQTSNQLTVESSNDHLGGDGISLCQSTNYGDDAHCSYIDIARMCIKQVEIRLLDRLLSYLQKCCHVHTVEDIGEMKVMAHDDSKKYVAQQQQQPRPLIRDESTSTDLQRIPIVCFVHDTIPSCEIVQHCRNQGLVCRACKFLSTDRLWDELDIKGEDNVDGIVRFSLAHYNTLEEIDTMIRILEMLDGWS